MLFNFIFFFSSLRPLVLVYICFEEKHEIFCLLVESVAVARVRCVTVRSKYRCQHLLKTNLLMRVTLALVFFFFFSTHFQAFQQYFVLECRARPSLPPFPLFLVKVNLKFYCVRNGGGQSSILLNTNPDSLHQVAATRWTLPRALLAAPDLMALTCAGSVARSGSLRDW